MAMSTRTVCAHIHPTEMRTPEHYFLCKEVNGKMSSLRYSKVSITRTSKRIIDCLSQRDTCNQPFTDVPFAVNSHKLFVHRSRTEFTEKCVDYSIVYMTYQVCRRRANIAPLGEPQGRWGKQTLRKSLCCLVVQEIFHVFVRFCYLRGTIKKTVQILAPLVPKKLKAPLNETHEFQIRIKSSNSCGIPFTNPLRHKKQSQISLLFRERHQF
jgi:hypothetical protein